MLTKKSLELATHIAKETNRHLVGSRTDFFVPAIRSSFPPMRNFGPSLESAADMLEGTTAHENHDVNVSEASMTVAQGLVKQFTYVRSKIVPFIDAVSESILERVKEGNPCEFNIQQFRTSGLAQSAVFLELVSKYNARPVDVPKLIKSAIPVDAPAALKYLQTNIAELDEATAEVIANLGESVVVDLFNSLFCDTFPKTPDNNSAIIRGMFTRGDNGGYGIGPMKQDAIDILALAFLMVDGAINDPVQSSGFGYQEYQTIVLRMRHQIGFALCRLLGAYENDVKNGRLLFKRSQSTGIHYEEKNGVILVYGEVLKEGLVQGLTPEAIMGAMTMERPPLFLRDFIARKQQLEDLYQKVVAQRDQIQIKEATNRLRNAVTPTFIKELQKLPKDYFPEGFDFNAVAQDLGSDKVTMMLRHHMVNWDIEDSPNIYPLVRDIAAKIVFTFVDAETVIRMFEEEMEEANGEMDGKEAAYWAMIKYYAYWAVGNFDIGE